MKLAKFITENMDAIIAEWEAFASTMEPAADTMTPRALRDHARGILQAIVRNMQYRETHAGGSDPAAQWIPEREDLETAAAIHGALRHDVGFDLTQLGAEYRALRASVVKLWKAHLSRDHDAALEDMTRFNESIDQALAESVSRYSAETSHSRDTFLAILGHDLRSPLGAIAMSAHYLARPGLMAGEDALEAAARIKRGAASMSGMIRDLLEYTRVQLGKGIPMAPARCDLDVVCIAAVDEVRAAHPSRVFELDMTGDLSGTFDGARLQQVLSNLLNNAVQHGTPDHPILLVAHGEKDTVILQVKNRGPLISEEALQVIFNPMVQVPSTEPDPDAKLSTSLGLGLFIAREIVVAHGGSIDAISNDHDGTVFTAALPKAGIGG